VWYNGVLQGPNLARQIPARRYRKADFCPISPDAHQDLAWWCPGRSFVTGENVWRAREWAGDTRYESVRSLQLVTRALKPGMDERDKFQQKSTSCRRRIVQGGEAARRVGDSGGHQSSSVNCGEINPGRRIPVRRSCRCVGRQRPSTILLQGFLETATAHSLVINGSL